MMRFTSSTFSVDAAQDGTPKRTITGIALHTTLRPQSQVARQFLSCLAHYLQTAKPQSFT